MSSLSALDVLAELVEAVFADDDTRGEWRILVSEIDAEGWLDQLDEHDARGVAVRVFFDVAGGGRGSYKLRTFAEALLEGEIDEIVHDPTAVADALSAIADCLAAGPRADST